MKKFIASLVLFVALVSSAKATIGYLSNPNIRVWNSAGTSVLTGGYIVTCVPGTVCNCTAFTGKTTYTDSTGLIPNTNPVLLDPTGSASIWYDGTAKIVACNSFGAIQWTKDNVPSVALGTSSTSATTEWIALSNTPSFLAANQFSVLGDYTSTFPTGRRLKLTQAGGDVYATVVSSSLLLGVTTVTVVVDSTAINVTLSGISVSLLDPTHTSIPFQPVVTKTTNYTLSAADCGKTIVYSSATATATFTLPAANAVPSGCQFVTKNTSTLTLTLAGTIDSRVSPTLTGLEEARVYSDGTQYFSDYYKQNMLVDSIVTKASVTPVAKTIVVRNTTNDLLDRNSDTIYAMSSEQTVSRIGTYTCSGATCGLASAVSVTLTAGDRVYVWGSTIFSNGTTSIVAMPYISTSGTATVVWGQEQASAWNSHFVPENATGFVAQTSGVAKAVTSGTSVFSLLVSVNGGTITGAAGPPANSSLYMIYWKKQ